jgi:hypothetical protein
LWLALFRTDAGHAFFVSVAGFFSFPGGGSGGSYFPRRAITSAALMARRVVGASVV